VGGQEVRRSRHRGGRRLGAGNDEDGSVLLDGLEIQAL
jgi:hypothetical protein